MQPLASDLLTRALGLLDNEGLEILHSRLYEELGQRGYSWLTEEQEHSEEAGLDEEPPLADAQGCDPHAEPKPSAFDAALERAQAALGLALAKEKVLQEAADRRKLSSAQQLLTLDRAREASAAKRKTHSVLLAAVKRRDAATDSTPIPPWSRQ